MEIKKTISEAVIKRLPRYYRVLDSLYNEHVKKVSSKRLSELLDITASQVRQDFSNFGGFGQQGYGYEVEKLRNEMARIIGLTRNYKMIIVGAGNIGKAIYSYKGFKNIGFEVVSLFDIDEKENLEKNILSINKLDSNYIDENKIEIGVIATPLESAQDAANKLIESGITNIWNFAATDIEVPSNVIVENIFMSDSLFVLAYRINH